MGNMNKTNPSTQTSSLTSVNSNKFKPIENQKNMYNSVLDIPFSSYISITSEILNECLVNQINFYHSMSIINSENIYQEIPLPNKYFVEFNKYTNSINEIVNEKENGNIYKVEPENKIKIKNAYDEIKNIKYKNYLNYTLQNTLTNFNTLSNNSTLKSNKNGIKMNQTVRINHSKNINNFCSEKAKNNNTSKIFHTENNQKKVGENFEENKNVIYGINSDKYKEYLSQKNQYQNNTYHEHNSSFLEASGIKKLNHQRRSEKTKKKKLFFQENRDKKELKNIEFENRKFNQFETEANSYLQRVMKKNFHQKKIPNKNPPRRCKTPLNSQKNKNSNNLNLQKKKEFNLEAIFSPVERSHSNDNPLQRKIENLKEVKEKSKKMMVNMNIDSFNLSTENVKEKGSENALSSRREKYKEYCKSISTLINKKTPKQSNQEIKGKFYSGHKVNTTNLLNGNSPSQQQIFTVFPDCKIVDADEGKEALSKEIKDIENNTNSLIKSFGDFENDHNEKEEENNSNESGERFSFKPKPIEDVYKKYIDNNTNAQGGLANETLCKLKGFTNNKRFFKKKSSIK